MKTYEVKLKNDETVRVEADRRPVVRTYGSTEMLRFVRDNEIVKAITLSEVQSWELIED